MTDAVDPQSAIELSSDELLLLRLTCELTADEESPLARINLDVDPERLENGARSLVRRGFADRRTYRPHREVVRRLLVVSEPDARIVLLGAGPGRAERVIDAYVRAGAYVAYRRGTTTFSFGPPLQAVDVRDEIKSHFTPRRSTGDFIRMQLTPAEYFAFVTFARELALHGDKHRGHAMPERSVVDATMDGAILMPGRRARFTPADATATAGRLAVPDEAAWNKAVRALLERDVLEKRGDAYGLRTSLHDLAKGIAIKQRFVLTRFDFGPSDWFVRDATLVPVPGSVFWLRTTRNGGLSIWEVDAGGLEQAVGLSVDDVEGVDTVDV